MPRPAAFIGMHLLYLDDSGSVKNAQDRHIVLAGLSVFERAGHTLSRQMDQLAERLWPDNPAGLEFHGTEIFSGKKQWRGIRREERQAAYIEALTYIAQSRDTRLFCAAVHRGAAGDDDPMELAFEHVASRFDRMLGRFHKSGNTQRGLIVLDETTYETSLQALATQFRTAGHRWGQLYNLAEVPLFVNSKATRLIQCADLVAHSARRYFELGDATYFDVIRNSFDSQGGIRYGLVHRVPAGEQCGCINCIHN
ncbi:uncharacterized protein DUF3800 [Sphingomonas sp. PP-CC-3A-396]|nr:uncharacterized protein DUF3800 [Sphingomonas sp. PP-CC-3A-396]